MRRQLLYQTQSKGDAPEMHADYFVPQLVLAFVPQLLALPRRAGLVQIIPPWTALQEQALGQVLVR